LRGKVARAAHQLIELSDPLDLGEVMQDLVEALEELG
jgi:hypothetical protein